MYTEINPGVLFDKKGHSSSIQTAKGFSVFLEGMIEQCIKNIYYGKKGTYEGEKLWVNLH